MLFRSQRAHGGRFNVIEGAKFADVRKLQADPTYNGATFQVASNFNCLETVSAEQDILKQSLTSYIFDPTQGPAAALGAPAGLLYRRYYLFNTLHNGEQQACWQWILDPFEEHANLGQLPCQKYGLGEQQVNLLHHICNEKTGIQMSPAGYVRLNNAKKDPSILACDDEIGRAHV